MRRLLPSRHVTSLRSWSPLRNALSTGQQTEVTLAVRATLAAAAVSLPRQHVLDRFVHHNPLRAFEHLPFNVALQQDASLADRPPSPATVFRSATNYDPSKRTGRALSVLAATFTDRGVAHWAWRGVDGAPRDFLTFFADLEGLGFAPWRRVARSVASDVRAATTGGESADNVAARLIVEQLPLLAVDPTDAAAVRAMLEEVRGWAAMFAHLEAHSDEAPENVSVSLLHFFAVHTTLQRSSMVAAASGVGWNLNERPLSDRLRDQPRRTVPPSPPAFFHSSAASSEDQNQARQSDLEARIDAAVVESLAPSVSIASPGRHAGARPAMQVYSCLDDRIGSFRRHLEQQEADFGGPIETFGVAGFFGLSMHVHSVDHDDYVSAPDGATATVTATERAVSPIDGLRFDRRSRLLGSAIQGWERLSFSPFGSLVLSLLAPLSLARLAVICFAPRALARLRRSFESSFLHPPETRLTHTLTTADAASLLADTFRNAGAHRTFAPTVLVLGHHASSENNPYAAAYDCGACGGHDGGPNARLFATLANDRQVRRRLATAHSIFIPDDTVFIGGAHDTTADVVRFFRDGQRVAPAIFASIERVVHKALEQNAMERCHRFASARSIETGADALRHVASRALDVGEVRPEFNHATNAAIVVGRRSLTRGRFLDRRAFLASYDPASDCDDGVRLERVLGPALVVCSGINLEYFFSTVDDERYGAGSKAPLNVVGLVGVTQGTAGDLRNGLPSQMTEIHAPVRALLVIDAPVDRVQRVLDRRADLSQLVRNQWVRTLVRDPADGTFYRATEDGTFVVEEARLPSTAQQPELNNSSYRAMFAAHRVHLERLYERESAMFAASVAFLLSSTCASVVLAGGTSLHPHGVPIVLAATALTVPVVCISRRYLHGDRIFPRFMALTAALLLGFNAVALAPNLEALRWGWTVVGFASVLLIASYNERPTVRTNATFVFAAYHLSDASLLIATALAASGGNSNVVAGCIVAAALLKSSQFPLTNLLVRSMEGPTPASALGYGALSAHLGLVLLTCTTSLWFEHGWARVLIAAVGAYTALHSSLVARIRADRKGALASATSATVGVLLVIVAAGYPSVALLLALGHAALRLVQVLRSPALIADRHTVARLTNQPVVPRNISAPLYKLAWRLRRLESDIHLLDTLQLLSRRFPTTLTTPLSPVQQYGMAFAALAVAGLPFTPVAVGIEQGIEHLMLHSPVLAGCAILVHFGVSVLLFRWVLIHILTRERFTKPWWNRTKNK